MSKDRATMGADPASQLEELLTYLKTFLKSDENGVCGEFRDDIKPEEMAQLLSVLEDLNLKSWDKFFDLAVDSLGSKVNEYHEKCSMYVMSSLSHVSDLPNNAYVLVDDRLFYADKDKSKYIEVELKKDQVEQMMQLKRELGIKDATLEGESSKCLIKELSTDQLKLIKSSTGHSIFQNIFAKGYTKREPHGTDKTVFNPQDSFGEVVKQGYGRERFDDGSRQGMVRNHACLDALETYVKKHKTSQASERVSKDPEAQFEVPVDPDPIVNLIEIRGKQLFFEGAIGKIIADLRKAKADPENDEVYKQRAAGNLLGAIRGMQSTPAHMRTFSAPLSAVMSSLQKPELMREKDFRAATSQAWKRRPKMLEEIDRELRDYHSHDSKGFLGKFFKKKERPITHRYEQLIKLHRMVENALGDHSLDSSRKNGLKILLGQLNYFKDKTASSKDAYGATEAVQRIVHKK